MDKNSERNKRGKSKKRNEYIKESYFWLELLCGISNDVILKACYRVLEREAWDNEIKVWVNMRDKLKYLFILWSM